MDVHEHQLARAEGNGSRDEIDDKYDSEEYSSKDQRADTQTTFYEKDINNLAVSERRKKELRRALRRNEGEDYGEGTSADKTRRQRKQQNREEWKRRVITAYAANLDMADAQKERATHLFMDVLKINSFGNYASEQVALGVLNVVAQEDGWFLEDEGQFHDLMIDCGMADDEDVPNMSRLSTLRRMVRERVPSMTA